MPVFLVGDFNAPSHLDWTPATVGQRPHVRSVVDWPVSRAIEAAGFRDTWREIHPDPVAEPGLTWWADRPPTGGYEPGPDTPNDRIDIIYAAGPSTTTDCRIVGEPGARDVAISVDPWPSDHRAVMATFRVSPAPMPDVVGASVATIESARHDPSADVRLETTKPAYRVGEPIDVRWAGGPGYRWDWIAVFRCPRRGPARRLPHLGAHRRPGRWHRAAGRRRRPSSTNRRWAGVWPLPTGRLRGGLPARRRHAAARSGGRSASLPDRVRRRLHGLTSGLHRRVGWL